MHNSSFSAAVFEWFGKPLLPALIAAAVIMTGCGESGPPRAEFETSMGTFVITLEPEKTPVTVENFIAYVEEGFYNGTIFHRVIPNFVVQGGGFDERMIQKKNRDPIINESDKGSSNVKGSISMARTNDPHSATSQFFINLRDNANLDAQANRAGYAVFGQVTEGMEVIEAMAKVKTGTTRGHSDVPNEPIVVKKARML